MTFVSELDPRPLWTHFDEILGIPRGSRNEEGMRRYVLAAAARHGLTHRADTAGNVVVEKLAAPGREGAAPTVLQSHLDMVNEKNSDVAHDFSRDPIRPRRDGDYLTAEGTTLGSDNGIGVAAMLALLEADDLAHGPLELLFTVEEETGLVGASALSTDLVRGRRLLNLDSEEEGSVYVGCAGGADSTLRLPLGVAPSAADTAAVSLGARGFRGGHSGVDIHLQRGNAIQLLARALHAVHLKVPFRLAAFSGGTAHNAIPREAFATAVVDARRREALTAAMEAEFAAIREEVKTADPEARLEVKVTAPPTESWDDATTRQALRLLAALPHGVQTMSLDLPGLVETSVNLATVRVEDGALVIFMAGRSSVASALAAQRRRLRALAALAGAEASEGAGYPGWKPDLSSPLLAVLRRVHERVLGSTPEVKAIHAGLETGVIGEKFAGMDMISFGPQIEFPHSPDERVSIPSVARFWRLLTAVLEELGEVPQDR